MTKNDLVDKLAAQTGLKRSQAIDAIEALMDIARESFVKGHNIYLRGFGTMKVVTRKSKQGQDIKKGKTITIPAHRTVKFIPSPYLKEKL